MGTYNSTYVGIYLEVPHYKHTENVTVFKHPKTGAKMKTEFCPNTGVKAISSIRENISYVEPSAYIDDEEGLEEDMFWSPVFSGAGKRLKTFILNERVYGSDELFNQDLSNINFQEKIEEFRIKYKKYLDYYNNLYGKVEICFGICNYAH